MGIQTINNVGYGLSSALPEIFNSPVVSRRAPATTDKAPIGQMWVDVTGNDFYVLTSIANNAAVWTATSNGSGIFTSITTTGAGGITAQLGDVTVDTGNVVVTLGDITASAGAVSAATTVTAGTTITAGTGITSTTGNIVATAGAVNAGTTMTAGTGITATTGNIVATAGAVNAGTTMTAGTGVTATTGNVTITNGNLVLSTAATKIVLPGPVNIMSGAGAPANGLAVNVGDMYINTTAASAATRIYVATAASTWTNVSCAA